MPPRAAAPAILNVVAGGVAAPSISRSRLCDRPRPRRGLADTLLGEHLSPALASLLLTTSCSGGGASDGMTAAESATQVVEGRDGSQSPPAAARLARLRGHQRRRRARSSRRGRAASAATTSREPLVFVHVTGRHHVKCVFVWRELRLLS